MIAPTRPTVAGSLVTSDAASSGVVPVARPTAVPAAATSAVRRMAVPVAVSHPKKAEPTLIPPYCSFSRPTTSRRVGIAVGTVEPSPGANTSSYRWCTRSSGSGPSRWRSGVASGVVLMVLPSEAWCPCEALCRGPRGTRTAADLGVGPGQYRWLGSYAGGGRLGSYAVDGSLGSYAGEG